MAVTDLPLWNRIRPTFQSLVTAWYFDAAVGAGQQMPADIPAEMLQGLWRLSRKRIDAVGETPTHWLLIELRPAAGLGALGHVQTYRSLWERDPPDTKPVRAYLVSDRADPDVLQTAINAAITVLVV